MRKVKVCCPKASSGVVNANTSGRVHYFDVFYLGSYVGRHAKRGGCQEEARERLLEDMAGGGYRRYYTEVYPI